MTDASPKGPREVGGEIAGPGGPYDQGGVVLDTRDAVLLDYCEVALVDAIRGGVHDDRPTLALQLDGRINKTNERARVLYLFDEDGAAAIVSQLLALASRIGPEFRDRLLERIREAPL